MIGRINALPAVLLRSTGRIVDGAAERGDHAERGKFPWRLRLTPIRGPPHLQVARPCSVVFHDGRRYSSRHALRPGSPAPSRWRHRTPVLSRDVLRLWPIAPAPPRAGPHRPPPP